MILLFNQDKLVADWASKKWGKSIPPWYHALGVLNSEGILKGAATFHNYNGVSIELSYYGPQTVTKDVMCGLAEFVFHKLSVKRLTVVVPRLNKVLNKNLPRLGFKMEGVMRHYYGPFRRDDGILYGMLKEESIRYLK